jgi:hypothetical protein
MCEKTALNHPGGSRITMISIITLIMNKKKMTMTERGDSTMKDGATRVRSSSGRERQQAKSKGSRVNLIVDGVQFFKSGGNI